MKYKWTVRWIPKCNLMAYIHFECKLLCPLEQKIVYEGTTHWKVIEYFKIKKKQAAKNVVQ